MPEVMHASSSKRTLSLFNRFIARSDPAAASHLSTAGKRVLLTGMGKDGAEELKLLREKGGVTIAQNKESCIVFGMPGEAVRIDAADYVLSPEAITAMLIRLANNRQRPVPPPSIKGKMND